MLLLAPNAHAEIVLKDAVKIWTLKASIFKDWKLAFIFSQFNDDLLLKVLVCPYLLIANAASYYTLDTVYIAFNGYVMIYTGVYSSLLFVFLSLFFCHSV